MNTITKTSIAFLAVVGLSFGCKNGGSGGDTDTTKTDTVFVDPGPECQGLNPKQFCWAGLDFVGIGDSLTWKTYEAPAGGVFKDTVFSDTVHSEANPQITDWNVRMLRFATGTVYLEADFDTGHLLNRFRIETPEYTMKNGLHVGSTAGEVFKAYEGEVLRILPFEEYGVMEVVRTVIVGDITRSITFHVPLGSWYQAGQPEYTPASIPADAKISRIVVM